MTVFVSRDFKVRLFSKYTPTPYTVRMGCVCGCVLNVNGHHYWLVNGHHYWLGLSVFGLDGMDFIWEVATIP